MKKKDLIELSITSCLVMVLLFAVINGVKSVNRSRRLRMQAGQSVSEGSDNIKSGLSHQEIAQQASADSKDTLFNRLEEETKSLTLSRDPFFLGPSKVIESAELADLDLTGILWDSKNPSAIINDTIVEVDGVINGRRVIEIKRESVILNDGTKNFELRL